jgi:hypothetical protein
MAKTSAQRRRHVRCIADARALPEGRSAPDWRAGRGVPLPREAG